MSNEIVFNSGWKGVRSGPPGLKACPGRNDPRYGRWMIEKLAPHGPRVVADPMCGGGQLWMLRSKDTHVLGCELREDRAAIARANGIEAMQGDALTWRPHVAPHLVGFSFSYPNCDHNSGKTEKQKAFVKSKGLESNQAIEPPPDLLRTYLQIATYCGAAPVATIVKNWIEEQAEVDWTAEVVAAANWAGFECEVFWHEVTPGFTEVAKVKRGEISRITGKVHRVVTRENVVVARLRR